MSEHKDIKYKYGVLGRSLSHSFSKRFFSEKFLKEEINAEYNLYELGNIHEFSALLEREKDLKGLNVTIPYKKQVIAYLDELDSSASETGAVNCIKILKGKKIGYNTDVFGFKNSLKSISNFNFSNALIIGNGGASMAVKHVLSEKNILFKIVARAPGAENEISFQALDAEIFATHHFVINTTPLGMYPDLDSWPPIAFDKINSEHFFYDLVYNPEMTVFLSKAKEKGARIKNGLEMLYLQAEKSWEIWSRG
jgi:shikimate dehydrogenase